MQGDDSVSASLGGDVTDWADFSGTNGTTPSATATALGKFISLSGGIAVIAPSESQIFTASGTISRDDYLAGGNNGTVTTGDPSTDFILGKALNDATDGQSVTVAYAPSNPNYWSSPRLTD